MTEVLWDGRIEGDPRRTGHDRDCRPRYRSSQRLGWCWPYLTIAVLLFLVALPVLGIGVGYGPLALLVSGLLIAPVAVVWFRPRIGWAMSLLPLIFLLPIDRMLARIPLEPLPWLAFQLAAQLPVIFVVALAPRRSIAYPPVAITLVSGLLAPYGSEFSAAQVPWTAGTWILAVGLTVVLARFRLHRRLARARIAEEEGLRRVLEERTRIARELHDVVAHHMSVITVQASTAPYRLDPGRPEIDREFQAIGSSARGALQELRQVLDVLRSADQPATPGLRDLPKLIESTRLAGVGVCMIINGPGPEPGAKVQHAAYRIVQEALSNVIKHAAGADTAVWISVQPSRLAIDVINERPPGRSGPSKSPGHGLTGTRERIESTGGTLLTGPTDRGGFQLRALLPSGP